MRFILSLMAVFLLPVLMLVHLRHFQSHLQPALEQQVRDVLATDPDLQWVKPSFSYLDVTLENMVPSLAARKHAEDLVRGMGIVRMPPENNRLQVPASLEGRPDGERLTLTGLVHDEATLKEVAHWLGERRPGLALETSQVEISPYVTRMDVRDPTSPDFGTLQQLLRLVTLPPAVKVLREGDRFIVSGSLPDAALRDAIFAALLTAVPGAKIEADHLETGSFVKQVSFTKPGVLASFFARYFALPESKSFTADERAIRFAAQLTEAVREEWQPLVDALGDRAKIQAEWRIYPSVYHLPGYQPESKLEPATLATLREVFHKNGLHFIPGSYSLSQDEMPSVNASSQALAAAGTGVKVIIGVYLEPAPDPKVSTGLAQRRADAVLEQFVDRGLPASWFQSVTFGAARAPGVTDDRNVELLVK